MVVSALFGALAVAGLLDVSRGSAAEPRPAAEAAVRRLRVAVAQPLVTPGDVPKNIQAMQPLVAEAAGRGAQLVMFSECGITGYDLQGVGAGAPCRWMIRRWTASPNWPAATNWSWWPA